MENTLRENFLFRVELLLTYAVSRTALKHL